MSAEIGVGDWVECVDDGPCPQTGKAPPLRRGGVYRVALVGRCPFWGVPIVGLEQVAHPWGPRYGYRAERFRPLPRSQHVEQLIEKLKQPAPTREPEKTRTPAETA